ncbi:two-component system CheB/CheR fusion protein [Actinoplanes campanulatus]|uniref:protein-glutamate O-methyltransferase n=1 Tax=Actinoplanes campanulatus TaxID=113559 RepID=A0A7W5AF93_9ACTN|nr:CheR family methyltransferase [Actinoplanes campanulatus]MBB3094987.1 two-component system CheB/CheR fusion protein [Actinoplanes campanulatus]GGN08734.1 chemotaxis protein CheR [Actinoplanes campanulatus]GID36282.1 chemotaxis protein CheR [Actinoplanes campanulatus]
MQATDPTFEALLVHLKETRGFDFTGYKRSSLMRRVRRRMSQVGAPGYPEYLDHLQVHPDEFTALFNTILINVTAFFRDADAWEYLRDEVLEPMVAGRPGDTPIRVWSAGCASGQEAYTLAIALAEILGVERFKERVKIYATDVDEEQLSEARQAAYGEREVRDLAPGLVERYFEPVNGRLVFRKDLRRSVIFGRNDLVQDAPISRIDLLTCRNTLMYFNAETQAKILGRFHFALAETGVLFLGKAEMLLSHSSLFAPIDPKRRVFRRVPRLYAPPGAVLADPPQAVPGRVTGLDELRNETFTASPLAQLALTPDGLVALSNRQLEKLFGVSSRDIGRPFRDLDLSYRPVELRRFVEQARLERRTLRVSDVAYVRDAETVHLVVQVSPLSDADGSLLGVNLIFHDVTAARRLQDELEHANHQLEAAYEELQSTNEELETTNEELQSTVEELETTNEELQSTNEELETMNEELQSTNDELQSINDQLRISTARLDEANAFLETVLTSLQAGVAVVDADLRIRMWNRHAEDLWGLRSGEVIGQHFLNLDIGLPIDRVRPLLRGSLGAGGACAETELDAVNRRGRPMTVRVACTPLRRRDGSPADGDGAIIVMETA